MLYSASSQVHTTQPPESTMAFALSSLSKYAHVYDGVSHPDHCFYIMLGEGPRVWLDLKTKLPCSEVLPETISAARVFPLDSVECFAYSSVCAGKVLVAANLPASYEAGAPQSKKWCVFEVNLLDPDLLLKVCRPDGSSVKAVDLLPQDATKDAQELHLHCFMSAIKAGQGLGIRDSQITFQEASPSSVCIKEMTVSWSLPQIGYFAGRFFEAQSVCDALSGRSAPFGPELTDFVIEKALVTKERKGSSAADITVFCTLPQDPSFLVALRAREGKGSNSWQNLSLKLDEEVTGKLHAEWLQHEGAKVLVLNDVQKVAGPRSSNLKVNLPPEDGAHSGICAGWRAAEELKASFWRSLWAYEAAKVDCRKGEFWRVYPSTKDDCIQICEDEDYEGEDVLSVLKHHLQELAQAYGDSVKYEVAKESFKEKKKLKKASEEGSTKDAQNSYRLALAKLNISTLAAQLAQGPARDDGSTSAAPLESLSTPPAKDERGKSARSRSSRRAKDCPTEQAHEVQTTQATGKSAVSRPHAEKRQKRSQTASSSTGTIPMEAARGGAAQRGAPCVSLAHGPINRAHYLSPWDTRAPELVKLRTLMEAGGCIYEGFSLDAFERNVDYILYTMIPGLQESLDFQKDCEALQSLLRSCGFDPLEKHSLSPSQLKGYSADQVRAVFATYLRHPKWLWIGEAWYPNSCVTDAHYMTLVSYFIMCSCQTSVDKKTIQACLNSLPKALVQMSQKNDLGYPICLLDWWHLELAKSPVEVNQLYADLMPELRQFILQWADGKRTAPGAASYMLPAGSASSHTKTADIVRPFANGMLRGLKWAVHFARAPYSVTVHVATLEDNLKLVAGYTLEHKNKVLELVETASKFLVFSPRLTMQISDLPVSSQSWDSESTPPASEDWYCPPSIY